MNLLWVRVRSWALCQHPAAISHVSTDACTFMCIPSPDLANSSPCSQAFCCKFQELNAHFTTSLYCCQRCSLVFSQGALPCTLPHPDPLSVLPPYALAPTRYSSLWLKHSAPSKVARQVKSPPSQSLLPHKFVLLSVLKSLVPGSPGEMLYVIILLNSNHFFYKVKVATSEYLSICWKLPVFTSFVRQ